MSWKAVSRSRSPAARLALQRRCSSRPSASPPSLVSIASPEAISSIALQSCRRPAIRRSIQSPSGEIAAAGRGEGAEQGDVVEGVGHTAEQAEGIGDLLRGPVAAATDDVGIEAGQLERLGVGVDVGERPQQQHHRSRIDSALGELAEPRRERPGLGHPPLRRLRGDGRELRPVSSSPHPDDAVSSSSTAGPSGPPTGAGSRPTASGLKSGSSSAPTRLTIASTSGVERKLPVSPSIAVGRGPAPAASSSRTRRKLARSAPRKP